MPKTRKHGPKSPKPKAGKRKPGPKRKAAAQSGEHHEVTFRTLVLETLGRSRAQELLNELASIGL